MASVLCYSAFILLITIFSANGTNDSSNWINILNRRYLIQTPTFTRCPNGFVSHDDSCYMASHDLADWPSAQMYCLSYGAHLAFIESAREQTFVHGYLNNAASTDPNHYYWLGGTDAVTEGEWIWSLVLKPVNYTNWSPVDPDNNVGHSSKHQDCMAMYASGMWDDGFCETLHNFVCEIELDVEHSNIIG